MNSYSFLTYEWEESLSPNHCYMYGELVSRAGLPVSLPGTPRLALRWGLYFPSPHCTVVYQCSALALWEGHCPTPLAILSLPLWVSRPLHSSLFAIGSSFLNEDFTSSGSQGEVASNLPSYPEVRYCVLALGFFETGSYYVDQAGLELSPSLDLNLWFSGCFRRAEIVLAHHRSLLNFHSLFVWKTWDLLAVYWRDSLEPLTVLTGNVRFPRNSEFLQRTVYFLGKWCQWDSQLRHEICK